MLFRSALYTQSTKKFSFAYQLIVLTENCGKGEFTVERYDEAIPYFHKTLAEDDEHQNALTDLSHCLVMLGREDEAFVYVSDQGVPNDGQQAVAWYRKAAEQGGAGAQVNLGVMYDYGQGAPKDDQLAVAWYGKAAGKGNTDAQIKLALMYDQGRGVPKGG